MFTFDWRENDALNLIKSSDGDGRMAGTGDDLIKICLKRGLWLNCGSIKSLMTFFKIVKKWFEYSGLGVRNNDVEGDVVRSSLLRRLDKFCFKFLVFLI